MTRSLATLLCFGATLFGAPARSEAGVIPWMYDAIFGYGPRTAAWGGYGGAPYGGGYMTGYAPFYSASYGNAAYGAAYGGQNCCGTTANYAPWTGYSYDAGCCSPCGGACNSCGGGNCDPGCSNCPGGNCGTGNTNEVPSTPSDSGSGANPTYAPPTNTNDKTLPADQFGPARNRDQGRPATSAPGTSPSGSSIPTFNTPAGGSPVGPDNSAPVFGPGEPTSPRPARGNEDSRHVPNAPFQPGEKVAFKTPARITRSELRPTFELPAIVSAPPRLAPEAKPTPTAVASK